MSVLMRCQFLSVERRRAAIIRAFLGCRQDDLKSHLPHHLDRVRSEPPGDPHELRHVEASLAALVLRHEGLGTAEDFRQVGLRHVRPLPGGDELLKRLTGPLSTTPHRLARRALQSTACPT